jgi:hypothetical protein
VGNVRSEFALITKHSINRNRGVVARTLVGRLGGGLLGGSASSHLAGTRTSRSVPVAKGDGSRVRSGLVAGREQDSNPRSPGRDRGPAHPESGAFLSGPAEPEGVSNQRACDRTLIHISPRSRVRSGAGWAEFGGIRDPAELSTTDPPNRCHLPVWHWRVEPLDIDDAFQGGNGIGDEYYLIADFEKLL